METFIELGIYRLYNNHDWRSTFGTQLKEANLSSAQVAALLFACRKPLFIGPPPAFIRHWQRSNLWSANFIVVTPHWGDHSLKFEKEIDEIPATGGHRFLSPVDVSTSLTDR